MKKISMVVVLQNVLDKYPLLENSIKKTYPGVEVLACMAGISGFVKRTIKKGDVLAIIVDDRFNHVDIFSDIEGLYKCFGKGIASLVFVKPMEIDGDISFPIYFSEFVEIRIKKSLFGNGFNIKWNTIASEYKPDTIPCSNK